MKVITRKQGAGNTNVIAIPAKLCRELNITPGTVLDVEQENDRIVMSPVEVEKK